MPGSSAMDQMTAAERKAELRHQRLEKLLPWGFSEKIAICLSVVKVPIIIFVTLIGLFAELRVKSLTQKTWLRGGGIFGPTSCYVDEINGVVGKQGLKDFHILETLNETSWINGSLNGHIFEINATLDPLHSAVNHDYCNVEFPKGADPNNPKVMCQGLDTLFVPHYSFSRGLDHIIPFSLLWCIYKLVFIGVYPIDRVVQLVSGDGDDGLGVEPTFKLLTEPYFRFLSFLMYIIAKIFGYFRYRLMPNVLLGALLTLEEHPQCHNYVTYKMDWFWGTACYYFIALDLFGLLGAYVAAKTVMGNQLIGTCVYRVHKILWLATSLMALVLPICGLFYTFGGIRALLQAIRSALTFLITLNLKISFNLDILRILALLVFFLEALELWIFISIIICPICCGCLPCCKCLKEADNDDDDQEMALLTKPIIQPPKQARMPAAVAPAPAAKHSGKGLTTGDVANKAGAALGKAKDMFPFKK